MLWKLQNCFSQLIFRLADLEQVWFLYSEVHNSSVQNVAINQYCTEVEMMTTSFYLNCNSLNITLQYDIFI
jgi:hypothetical protein